MDTNHAASLPSLGAPSATTSPASTLTWQEAWLWPVRHLIHLSSENTTHWKSLPFLVVTMALLVGHLCWIQASPQALWPQVLSGALLWLCLGACWMNLQLHQEKRQLIEGMKKHEQARWLELDDQLTPGLRVWAHLGLLIALMLVLRGFAQLGGQSLFSPAPSSLWTWALYTLDLLCKATLFDVPEIYSLNLIQIKHIGFWGATLVFVTRMIILALLCSAILRWHELRKLVERTVSMAAQEPSLSRSRLRTLLEMYPSQSTRLRKWVMQPRWQEDIEGRRAMLEVLGSQPTQDNLQTLFAILTPEAPSQVREAAMHGMVHAFRQADEAPATMSWQQDQALQDTWEHQLQTQITSLQEKEPSTQERACEALAMMGRISALDFLHNLVKEDTRHTVRAMAIAAMGQTRNPTVIPHLSDIVFSPKRTKEERFAAKDAIVMVGQITPTLREDLQEILATNRRIDNRRFAAILLHELKDTPSFSLLARRLRQEPDPHAQVYIIQALAVIARQDSPPTKVTDLLAHPAHKQRVEALQTYEVYPTLTRLILNEKEVIFPRIVAIKALADLTLVWKDDFPHDAISPSPNEVYKFLNGLRLHKDPQLADVSRDTQKVFPHALLTENKPSSNGLWDEDDDWREDASTIIPAFDFVEPPLPDTSVIDQVKETTSNLFQKAKRLFRKDKAPEPHQDTYPPYNEESLPSSPPPVVPLALPLQDLPTMSPTPSLENDEFRDDETTCTPLALPLVVGPPETDSPAPLDSPAPPVEAKRQQLQERSQELQQALEAFLRSWSADDDAQEIYQRLLEAREHVSTMLPLLKQNTDFAMVEEINRLHKAIDHEALLEALCAYTSQYPDRHPSRQESTALHLDHPPSSDPLKQREEAIDGLVDFAPLFALFDMLQGNNAHQMKATQQFAQLDQDPITRIREHAQEAQRRLPRAWTEEKDPDRYRNDMITCAGTTKMSQLLMPLPTEEANPISDEAEPQYEDNPHASETPSKGLTTPSSEALPPHGDGPFIPQTPLQRTMFSPRTAPPSPLNIPDPFEDIIDLHLGPWTQIYRAYHRLHKFNCVLKIATQPDERCNQLILNEAHALRSCRQPGLIEYLGTHTFGDRFAIMLPWLEGHTLVQEMRARYKRRHPWSLEEVEPLLLRILNVLEHMHLYGWTHGDIKPENLFYHGPEQLTLFDLGTARRYEAPLSATKPPQAGTPYYMAPEQLYGRGGGPRIDIYAIGILIYEWFAGKIPLGVRPPRLSTLRPDLPPSLDEVVEQATAFDPAERYNSIHALRLAFLAASSEQRQASLPPLPQDERASFPQ